MDKNYHSPNVYDDQSHQQKWGWENVKGHQRNQQYPVLFGEDQLVNGFGPVYALPTFPWEPIPSNRQQQGEYHQRSGKNQFSHGYKQRNNWL